MEPSTERGTTEDDDDGDANEESHDIEEEGGSKDIPAAGTEM